MKIFLLMLTVFTAGLSIGWFGNSLLESERLISATSKNIDSEEASDKTQSLITQNRNPTTSIDDNSKDVILQDVQAKYVPESQPEPQIESPSYSSSASITDTFNRLLNDRQYQDAINLYQEQKNQNTKITTQLRNNLIAQLKLLTDARRNSDFSTLIEHYLSAYYDDLDFLLLLANFNQANSSFLEVVDVYLLAKTYAYTDIDQQRVLNRFNGFVEEIDRLYTGQKNWWSLINFYSHLNTSGLMTSTHQYQQALAYLRSGDKDYAIAQLNQLLTDSVIGESAVTALNNLDNHTSAPATDIPSVQDHAESIALQKIGNQFSVNLSDNRQDTVKLLIDTGASMTTISIASFSSLGIGTNAIEQDRRVFRTAGGVVMGTVYVVPELRLGTYLLQNTRVAVIDFKTDRDIDGLLGMNILGQFRFQIDQENAQLHLSKK